MAELVSNHPPCPHTPPKAGQICITAPSLTPPPAHGAISHPEPAAELGAFLLPFPEPLPHPSGDRETGRAAGSILSVGTSTVPVLPFSSSASSLLISNIPFAARSAPGILEALFSMTSKIPFLGGDAPVRVCHWAIRVRTGFNVFFLSSLGCFAPCSGTWTQQLQRAQCCCQMWSLCWPCPFPDNLWAHSMVPHV